MIGNGGVFASADDLLTFLSASSGLIQTPLASAFALLVEPQKPLDDKGGAVGLGWHLWKRDDHDIVWHNGGTAGFSTFAAYDRQKRQGVVVLSNASTEGGVDDIGMHLIAGGPLEPAGSPRVTPTLAVAIDPRLLDNYTGEYELSAEKLLTVTRNGDQLSFELPGPRQLPVYPQSERVFRVANVGITFSFEMDERGAAVALIMEQGGQKLRMPRRPTPAKNPSSQREPPAKR